MARTASSSRCWGSALRRESSAGAQVKRRCSWASVSWLPQLELQLGSHFTPQRRCGQGCLTTCCPNTAEGAVELVQLCLVGVQHLGSWLGFEPHLTFSCPNLNKGKLEEKRVRLTTFTVSNTGRRCVFSNVSSKRLHGRMHSRIGCICLTFPHCVFSNVSSDCMPQRMHSRIGCIFLFSPLGSQMSPRIA